jgi:Mitochondrial carrier protein
MRLLNGGNDKNQKAWHPMAGGVVSGLAVSFWLTPVELLKVRLQAPESAKLYRSPLHCLKSVLATEGASTLMRGHTATMIRETIGGAFYFGMYETACSAMTPVGKTREDLHSLKIMTAGALGGISYWTATFPADTIKSTMQSDVSGKGSRSFVTAMRTAIARYGIRGLYSGWGVTVVRAIPSNGTIFLVYETVSRMLKEM